MKALACLLLTLAPVPDVDELEFVKQILKEIDVAPMRTLQGNKSHPRAEDLPKFDPKKRDEYKPDAKTSGLRDAVVKAREQINEQVKALSLLETVQAPSDEATFKETVLVKQKAVAHVILKLTEAQELLLEAGKQRDQEASKRWLANYDFLLARVQIHIAFLYEYQSALGLLRKDLPNLDKPGDNGWVLAERDGLQGDVAGRTLAKTARKGFEQLSKDHPGTPWEAVAKMYLKTPLGLRWESTQLGAGPRKKDG